MASQSFLGTISLTTRYSTVVFRNVSHGQSWYSNVYGGNIRYEGLPMWDIPKNNCGIPSCKGYCSKKGLRGHQSENLSLMGTMCPLVKHRTAVLVLIAKTSRYQWTMYVQRVLNTNLLHLQMVKIWGGMSIWGVPKFKPVLFMMGIIIALSIRIRSYRYWMRLSRRSYGCATKTLYETILCSQDLWARILILQGKWRAI